MRQHAVRFRPSESPMLTHGGSVTLGAIELRIPESWRVNLQGNAVFGAYEDKTATLSDIDTVWTDVRHMHMREAIDKLMADFNKFIQENAVFKGYFSHCHALYGFH